jgi:hypothetical protein
VVLLPDGGIVERTGTGQRRGSLSAYLRTPEAQPEHRSLPSLSCEGGAKGTETP